MGVIGIYTNMKWLWQIQATHLCLMSQGKDKVQLCLGWWGWTRGGVSGANVTLGPGVVLVSPIYWLLQSQMSVWNPYLATLSEVLVGFYSSHVSILFPRGNPVPTCGRVIGSFWWQPAEECTLLFWWHKELASIHCRTETIIGHGKLILIGVDASLVSLAIFY